MASLLISFAVNILLLFFDGYMLMFYSILCYRMTTVTENIIYYIEIFRSIPSSMCRTRSLCFLHTRIFLACPILNPRLTTLQLHLHNLPVKVCSTLPSLYYLSILWLVNAQTPHIVAPWYLILVGNFSL